MVVEEEDVSSPSKEEECTRESVPGPSCCSDDAEAGTDNAGVTAPPSLLPDEGEDAADDDEEDDEDDDDDEDGGRGILLAAEL